jgi:hypothetical protein
MGIAGNLKTMEFSELLQWVQQGTKSGTLVIDSGNVEKRVMFQKGRIIAAASTDPKEYLGHYLVSHGFLDESTLADAMERQATEKMMLGKILVGMEAISEADLNRMLRLQSEETIYDVFTWTEGDFRFLDDELPEYPLVPLRLDVTGVVLEGVQRLDEWKQIRQLVTSSLMVPVAVGVLEAPEDEPQARLVLEAVDDDRSIEDIVLHLHTSEFKVSRVLFDQARAKKLKLVRPRGSSPSSGSAILDSNGIDVSSLLQAAAGFLRRDEFEEALGYLRAAQNLEPQNGTVKENMQRVAEAIGERLEEAGIRDSAIPKLARPLAELTQLELSPHESFILSRINDSYDVRTVVQICPVPPLDAQLAVWRLYQAGHIKLQRGRR